MWVHPQDANLCLPKQEANGWPTGPVRLCGGVRMQELHELFKFFSDSLYFNISNKKLMIFLLNISWNFNSNLNNYSN